MRIVITGGAGFIGSSLAESVLEVGHSVIAIDDFSSGSRMFIDDAEKSPRFELIEMDLLEKGSTLPEIFEGADLVAHLAANADVRYGWKNPHRDLNQNVIVTHHVLEGVRIARVPRLIFSSTGSVYGEASVIPTPEDCPFPAQTSLYGASKLAAEGLISAYAEGCALSATVLRFVSILGPRYTHGHVVDFMKQLLRDETRLTILGDGTQKKSYLDVSDCVRAITMLLEEDSKFEVYNLGVDDHCTVDASVGWICERLGMSPERIYTGGARGWVGDNPFIYLATDKIRERGWRTRYSIREAVERTVDYLVLNRWVLDRKETKE